MPDTAAERMKRLQVALSGAARQGDLVKQEVLLKHLVTAADDVGVQFRAQLLLGRVKKSVDLVAAREGLKQSRQQKRQFKEQLKTVRADLKLRNGSPFKSVFRKRRGL